MFNRIITNLTMLSLSSIAYTQSPLDGMTDADLVEGKRVFKVYCARCHGISGAGGEGSNLIRAKLKYASDDEALIDVIGSGIAGTGMPANWTLDEQTTVRVAAYVRSLGRLVAEEMPGDPLRGAEIYRGKGACATCHIIAGHGRGIGPELTSVGDQRGLGYLRQSLLDPAAAQARTQGFQDFLTVRAATTDRQVEGVRVNEDAFTVQIRDLSGQVHSFRKNELENFEKIFAHSLMPDYAAALSDADIDDLVSYMMSLRSDP